MEKRNLKKILFIAHKASDFLFARMSLSRLLVDEGWRVVVVVPSGKEVDQIKSQLPDIEVIHWEYERESLSMIDSLKFILKVRKVVKNQKPDIVQNLKLKPNVFGTLGAFLAGHSNIVCLVAGLGAMFSEDDLKSRIYRGLNLFLYQVAFVLSKTVIVQNREDGFYLKANLIGIGRKIRLIPGSGVDTDKFKAVRNNGVSKLKRKLGVGQNVLLLTFVSRLIRQKGIEELLEAMRKLNSSPYSNLIALVVVGDIDSFNPHSVGQEIYENHIPNVFFLRERDDVREILEDSDGFILPTYYREGIPRSILEAMSMSLPIITTNVPGCNVVVVENENGFIIEPKSTEAIVEAIIKLKESDIKLMGKKSRDIVTNKYSTQIINSKYQNLYKEIA